MHSKASLLCYHVSKNLFHVSQDEPSNFPNGTFLFHKQKEMFSYILGHFERSNSTDISAKHSLSLLDSFAEMSGLKVNYKKTEAFWNWFTAPLK